MCYNAETGHWVKEPQAFVGWAHSELKLQDFHLKQCLYGEHLLTNSSSPVMLVESEKTAVVMSRFIPDYIWLVTGGKNGCFNSETMQVLKGREVTLIPDLGATEQWKEKSLCCLEYAKGLLYPMFWNVHPMKRNAVEDWTLQTFFCIRHQRDRYSTR